MNDVNFLRFNHFSYQLFSAIKNGFGFVDFDDYRDAEDAVQDLNGKEMSGAG